VAGERSRVRTTNATSNRLSRMTRIASFLLSNFNRNNAVAVAHMTTRSQKVGDVGSMTTHPPYPLLGEIIAMIDSRKRA
jgi:hypothetical protein